ncbi:DUF6268 family outer membrane beta-barrel protein [Spirosoma litoris]
MRLTLLPSAVRMFGFPVAFLTTFVVQAQRPNLEIAGLEYRHTRLSNDSLKGHVNSVAAFLNFPILKTEKRIIGGRFQFNNSQLDLPDKGSFSVTRLDLNLFWQRNYSETTKLQFFVQGGLYSDFVDISGEDMRYAIGGSYTIRHGPRLTSGSGVQLARQFFGYQINPFIAIHYDISDRLHLSGLLPIRPRLDYQLSESISWVSEISGNLTSYRLSQQSRHSEYVKVTQWYGLSSLAVTVKKRHKFSAGLGYDFRNQIQLYGNNSQPYWSIITFPIGKPTQPIVDFNARGLRMQVSYHLVLNRNE